MAYTEFVNGQEPYLSDTVLNNMQKGLMELVFPIGATYITQTDVNPNSILGFGIWERLKGRVCVGLDENDTAFDTIGETGGEKTHQLTVNEMPSHNHDINGDAGNWSGAGTLSGWGATSIQGDNFGRTTLSFTGGNQPHNNLQPYKVVGYMWIRTN